MQAAIKKAAAINFEAKIIKINGWTLLVLPKSASEKLPSRGMTLVEGTVNDYQFKYPLEPDGRGSHWLNADKNMLENIGAKVGDTVNLSIEPSKGWPEPDVPADFRKALAADNKANELWQTITPMARWDWLRWIASTGRDETRKRHIEVALSKLNKGMRRPCCFNRSICTVPEVSKNGALLEPVS